MSEDELLTESDGEEVGDLGSGENTPRSMDSLGMSNFEKEIEGAISDDEDLSDEEGSADEDSRGIKSKNRHKRQLRRKLGGSLVMNSMNSMGTNKSFNSESSYDGSRSVNASFDYSTLEVDKDVKDLFEFIDLFRPSEIDLDTRLKPFIPEYIPSVGTPESFLMIDRPNVQKKDLQLGLKVLNEPSSEQSDPSILNLQLRTIFKAKDAQVEVGSIENADKNPKQIQSWLTKLKEMNKGKASNSFTYSKSMPEIEKLMQEWPHEMESLLSNVRLPTAQLDVGLKEFIKILCAVLDIPVYNNNLVEPLHVLFTLYSAFKENQHFG